MQDFTIILHERIQVIGKAEWSFLETMGIELRKKRIDKYFSFNLKCLMITRDLEPQEELIKAAEKNKIYGLTQNCLVTTKFISKLTIYLADKLAPETRIHGVLVDVLWNRDINYWRKWNRQE